MGRVLSGLPLSPTSCCCASPTCLTHLASVPTFEGLRAGGACSGRVLEMVDSRLRMSLICLLLSVLLWTSSSASMMVPVRIPAGNRDPLEAFNEGVL